MVKTKEELLSLAMKILKSPDVHQMSALMTAAPYQFQPTLFDIPIDELHFIRVAPRKIKIFFMPGSVENPNQQENNIYIPIPTIALPYELTGSEYKMLNDAKKALLAGNTEIE